MNLNIPPEMIAIKYWHANQVDYVRWAGYYRISMYLDAFVSSAI